ncbi:MAG: hypothetical protein M9899_09370 [Bdellovibrionaceae bacterium]|nr:hypothetical protein [Pseudobdellovibrionaceae bacterium]
MKLRTLAHMLLTVITCTACWSTNAQTVDSVTDDPFVSVDIIESIECRNNSITNCDFIKKQLLLNVGQKVDDNKLNHSRTRLKLLGLFTNVQLALEKGSNKGKVKLIIDVKEDSPIYTVTSVSAGGEFFAEPKDTLYAQTVFTLGHRNLFGKGKNLSASITAYNDQYYPGYIGSTLLRYNDPNLFDSKKWFFNIDLFMDLDKRGTQRGESYLASFELGKRFGKFSYLTLGTVAERSHFYVKNTTKDFSIYQQYYSLGYGYNTQDDLFFPTYGARFDLKILIDGHSKTLSGERYIFGSELTGDVDFSVISEVGKNWYISLFAESRDRFFDQDNFLNSGIGTEIAYQSRRNQSERTVSDIRYFISPAFNRISGSDSEASITAGVKLRHKDYGLVRLQVVGGGL